MKNSNKKLILGLTALSLATGLSMQTAQANSSYTGTAGLNITITGIHNQSNPGAGYGNDILYSGYSELDPSSGSITPITGNVTPLFASDPLPGENEPAFLPANFNFDESMQVVGTVSDGNIESYYFMETVISLENTSSDSYLIDYIINYNVSVQTSGEDASATASITGDNIGLPDDDGLGGYIEVGNFSDSFSETGLPQLSFLLEADDIAELYAAFEFSGEASATASPVPLPGAVWLFFAGLLALPKFKKR